MLKPLISLADRRCRCGHSKEQHAHYRAGSDCGTCGRTTCASYSALLPLLSRLRVGIRAGGSLGRALRVQPNGVQSPAIVMSGAEADTSPAKCSRVRVDPSGVAGRHDLTWS